MKVEIRNGKVHLSGYINAVERFSKPITEELHGVVRTFIERIRAGAFAQSLKTRKKVNVLINHDNNSKITDTLKADCELREDKIGLHFDISSSHPKLLKAIKRGFSGCSFGMVVLNDVLGTLDGVCTRTITALDLQEVSILDTRKIPAYDGTMIETRALKGGKIMVFRTDETAKLSLREFIEKFGDEKVEDVLDGLKAALNAETRDDDTDPDDTDPEDDETDDTDPEDNTDGDDDVDDDPDDPDDDGDDDADDDPDDPDPEDDETDDTDETRAVNYSYFEERLNAL